ncbi:MAG TPA: IS5 family transposase [Natronosporangium sp.]|nr:IS5 family transposase [Natronosporangium sp.]
MCNCKPGGDARPCYPSSLSDQSWAVIEPLMPARDRTKGGALRRYGDRLVLEAILFVLRSGCQWRMIPTDLPPWDAAYRWYRTWSADGTFERIHDALRDQVRHREGRDPDPTAAVVDAQSILTGQGGTDRGYDAAKRTRGRKRHIAVDASGLLLEVMVTSASVQDRHGGRPLLQRLAAAFPSIGLVWADAGYANKVDSTLLSWAREKLGLVVEVVKRSDGAAGFEVLPRRWVVERTFGWLVANRRLARDYERLTGNSEAMVTIAMIRLMAARLAGERIQWANRAK